MERASTLVQGSWKLTPNPWYLTIDNSFFLFFFYLLEFSVEHFEQFETLNKSDDIHEKEQIIPYWNHYTLPKASQRLIKKAV